MAKRIKIKGKTPRGLSKKERIVEGADARFKGEKRYVKRNPSSESWMDESYLETAAGQRDYAAFSKDAKRGATRPSSTRKKLVKEGSRKFIGPRQLRSELAEDNLARAWEKVGPDDEYVSKQDSIRGVRKKRVPRKNAIAREFGDYRDRDEFGPQYGRESVSKNKRLKKLLSDLLKRHFEGADELGVARGEGPFQVPLSEYHRYLAEKRAFGND